MKNVTVHPDGTQSADFTFDFDSKAMAVEATVDEASGDLIIEGLAADFNPDRQDEAFEPGAFSRGLAAFMDSNPVLLYHHKYDQALGQITQADLTDEGLRVKARVDKPATGTWAEDVVNKIRSGTIRGFSVGGIFRRKLTPKGWRIHDVDLAEISATPFPINPRTTFGVLAGKAFENAPEDGRSSADDATAEIISAIDRLDAVFDALGGKAKEPDATEFDKHVLASLIQNHQHVVEDSNGRGDTVTHPTLKTVLSELAADHEKRLKALHRLAAKIGPIPALGGA